MKRNGLGGLLQNITGKVDAVSQQYNSLNQEIDRVASELSRKTRRDPAVTNKKIDTVATALARANRKLDHVAADFSPRRTEGKRFRAA